MIDHLKRDLRGDRLHTVCEAAKCPNIATCFQKPTATFMILGEICTRHCRFCNVTSGTPHPPNCEEPRRVGERVVELGLKHVVITSVTRDDLPDQGVTQFIKTVRAIRKAAPPSTTIELLIPDLLGEWSLLKELLKEPFEILNHNLETVPRLYQTIRPGANYHRSLELLQLVVDQQKQIAKTGIMVGLGEHFDEVAQLAGDLAEIGVKALTIGQYLRPSRQHHPVVAFITPEQFEILKAECEARGVPHVFAAPLVRSSYNAEQFLAEIKQGAN